MSSDPDSDVSACICDTAAAAAASMPEAAEEAVASSRIADDAAKEEALRHNVFARRGCERLLHLLDTLLDVFPDNIKLSLYRNVFVSSYVDDVDNEQLAMRTWYNELKFEDGDPARAERAVDLFQATRDGNADALLDANLTFLEAIDGRAIYAELLEDERSVLMDHLRKVNECAEMFINMPPEIMSLVKSVVRNVDVTQPLAPASLVPLMQEALFTPSADDDTDPTERLIGMSMQMMKVMQNGGLQALLGMINSNVATSVLGDSDGLSGLLGSLTREMVSCQELIDGEMSEETTSAASSMLSTLLGGTK